MSALYQFSLPYCPWARKPVSEECKLCGCTCGRKRSVPNGVIEGIKAKKFRKGSSITGKLKHIVKFKQDPPSFYIPRVRELKCTADIVLCWRFGKFYAKQLVPLYRLLGLNERVKEWDQYSDKWWKESSSKSAFSRITRIIEKLVICSNNACGLNGSGSDQD